MFCKKIILLCLTGFVLSLVGCNAGLYYQSEANVADVKERQICAIKRSNSACRRTPSLLINQGLYVDRTPISLERNPAWLKNHIVLRGSDLPFSYYSRIIANGGGTHVLTRYQIGLDPLNKVSINYSGTVKGALDLLSAKTGYIYVIKGKNVYWQAYITKTFDIAFMPGSSDYMMGKSSTASLGAQNAGSVAGGQSQVVSAIIDDSAASQYSNLKGTLSIWKDLEDTIKQLLSPEGKVMVSEATTTVTVRDKASNVDLVAKYIMNLNHNLSKQVLVKVQVLDVNLTSDFVYGINWQIVQRFFGGGSNFVLNANEGTPITITTISNSIPQFGFRPRNAAATTFFNVLVNALTQQGKVSVVTEPRVVCLNNQVSAIRIINQQGYLASVQNTTIAGSAGGSSGATAGTITSQITPGTLVTGLTLYILPKILGDKVYLQINADLSDSQGIQTISSTTGASPSTANTSPIIQVPRVTQKLFNQRSMIHSGDTLILAGFRRIGNEANAMQLWDSQALGGRGASQSNTETVVLITPIILHGCA